MQKDYSVWSDDLFALGKWIKESKDLIIKNKILYVPSIHLTQKRVKAIPGLKTVKNEFANYNSPSRHLMESRNILAIAKYKQQNFYKTINLSLPYIHEIHFTDFVNVMLENEDKLTIFQEYLNYKMTSIARSSKTEINKLELEIGKQLVDIENEYKRTISKYFRKSGVSAVGTVPATAIMVNNGFSGIVHAVAGIGSAEGLLHSVLRYRSEIEKSGHYFLWILSKK